MTAKQIVEASILDIRRVAEAGPKEGLYTQAGPLVEKLLAGTAGPVIPATLLGAPGATAADYVANWEHQLWYEMTELDRVAASRKERAQAQGGDSWTNVPKPLQEAELASHLQEIAKLRALIENPPKLFAAKQGKVLFQDALLDRSGAWEYPPALEVERNEDMGVRWRGQNPGGDWFWLKQTLPDQSVSIRFDVYPVDTLKGGLIVAFAATPVKPGTPLAVASSSSMADYFNNFSAYHFSVNRGSSGYCNLRRTGCGLVMLTSFSDPCPQYGRWYELEIVKAGQQVELRVGGKLNVCYVDLGNIQPALNGGHFGLRHFQGLNAWHRNVQVTTLE